MGIYKTVCYKVEDFFIKIMTRNQNPEEINQKIADFRNQKEIEKQKGV